MNEIPFVSLLVEMFSFIGGVSLLVGACWADLRRGPFEWRLLSEQIYQIGTRSLPLVVVTAVASGMVMTLQFGIGLQKFGGIPYIPKLVSLSILREMGPIFTSLMIAARVGAGIASEVGSMVVTQQVDAMRALGTSHLQKIVIPRVFATLITLPLLTAIANLIGIFGALMIGRYELNLDPAFFFQKALPANRIADFVTGFGKTYFFAFIIATVSCYYGLSVKEGTKEVGIVTTKAVVTTSILVLVGDFFLTKLFWVFER